MGLCLWHRHMRFLNKLSQTINSKQTKFIRLKQIWLPSDFPHSSVESWDLTSEQLVRWMVFWSSDSFQRELHLSELDVNIETLKLETSWHRLIMNWLSCLAWHSFALSVLNIQMKAYLSWSDLIIFHLFISPSKNGWESYHGLDLCFLPRLDRYLEAWAHQNIQSVLQPIFGLDKICTADLIVGNLYDNVHNEQSWRPPLTFQWRSRWFSMLKTFSRQNVVKYEFYVCWMFFIIIGFSPMCSWFGPTILTMLMCYIYNLKYIYIAGLFCSNTNCI